MGALSSFALGFHSFMTIACGSLSLASFGGGLQPRLNPLFISISFPAGCISLSALLVAPYPLPLFFIGSVACLPFDLSGGFSNGGLSDGCLSGLWSAGFRFWC